MSGKRNACVSGEFILVHRWFVSRFEGKTSGYRQMELKSLHFIENNSSFLLKLYITPVVEGTVTY